MLSTLRTTPYKKDRLHESKGSITLLLTNLKEWQAKMKISYKLKEFEEVYQSLIRATKDKTLDIIDRECVIDDNIMK